MKKVTTCEQLSVFDIFKIGIGPSSSHTLGPWRAALDFADTISTETFDYISIDVYGSLAKTGDGHGTPIALQLGLSNHDPVTIDTNLIHYYIQQVATNRSITINNQTYPFNPQQQIIYHSHCLPHHPNALICKAWYATKLVIQKTYYSIGGGFIEIDGETQQQQSTTLPYPISTGRDICEYTATHNVSMASIVHTNERAFRSEADIQTAIQAIFDTILTCVYKGCTTNGTLPGGLHVKRRAANMCQNLLKQSFTSQEEWRLLISNSATSDFTTINNWLSCFALAVNEENAAFGRIVTSPTNGAAGVIPAVLLYHYFFDNAETDLQRFFFVAGEIGCLFKKGATISAAVGGCQAEIGVSSAMAAAGLTCLRGGSTKQILMAAEIAMEHHLGLTCDPIKGLVQVPCIERNAMGAIKAVTASSLALQTNPADAIVDIDAVINTMWQTAQDMNSKYKETAEGGLAINLAVNVPEC